MSWKARSVKGSGRASGYYLRRGRIRDFERFPDLRLDRIPEPDEQFDVDYKGYNFKILSVVKKMIGSVLVRKLPEEKTPQNAEDGHQCLKKKENNAMIERALLRKDYAYKGKKL